MEVVGTNRLNAVIAALATLSPSLQPATLRQYLEYGLERLQAVEEEHYRFLGECAQLAAGNVQDVRLMDLEKRVAAIEGTDGRSWGETVADIALNAALQFATLAAAHGAAALVVAVAGRHALRSALSLATRSVSQSQADAAEAQGAINFLMSIRAKDKFATTTTMKVRISSGGETRTIRHDNVEDWLGVMQELVGRREDAINRTGLTQRIPEQGAAAFRRVLDAFDNGRTPDSAAIARYWSNWKDFVGGDKGGLVLDPIQSTFERVIATVQGAAGETDDLGPYLGSTLTGHFLDWTSQERLQIVDQFANFRLSVRYAPDSDLKTGSDLVIFLAHLVAEELPKWQVLHNVATAARPWIVSGFEAAFWREYLRSNGILDIDRGVSYDTTLDRFHAVRGAIRSGYLIQENPSPDRTAAKADLFRGVLVMTDFQADYLFNRYAKRYFDAMSNPSDVLVFDYRNENYTNAAADVFGVVPNNRRKRHLDQMRVMVILYFESLDLFQVDSRLKPLLAYGETLGTRDDALRGTVGIAPAAADVSQLAADVVETAEVLESLIALGDNETTRQIQLAQLAFVDRLTDLNQDIQAYLLLSSGAYGYESSWDQRTDVDLAAEIQREQGELERQFDELVELAAADGERVSEIRTLYQDAVAAITHWTPGSEWVWYAATPDEVEP